MRAGIMKHCVLLCMRTLLKYY